MKRKKWKTTLFISIVLVVLGAAFGVFYAVIINTPNLNLNVKFVATNVLGTIDAKVYNADNGMPSVYFSYDYTTNEPQEKTWKSRNLLFKGDSQTISIEFKINNMGHYAQNININYKNPHKNAKVLTYLNGEEKNINNLIIPAETQFILLIVIGKEIITEPIRANLNLVLELSEV